MHVDLTVVFERSWRIGSGQAAGRHVDDLVRCDGNGLPFVPGSTLRGLVSDAARRLAGTLGIEVCDGTLTRGEGRLLGRLCGVSPGDGMCPLCILTGSNHRPAAVSFEPARLVLGRDDERIGGQAERRRVAEVALGVPGLLTRHRTRTAIDHASGRADDEHLFALEEAVSGLELAARLRIDSSDPHLAPRDLALLVAALRFLREVGGGRRRGLGRCRVHIDAADLEPAFGSWQDAVESLARDGAAEDRVATQSPQERRRSTPGPRLSGVPAVLAVDATVVGEVAIGGRPESGNRVAGLAFVPGSALRGALAARWCGDRSSAAFARVFLSEKVRFGYLYPRAGRVGALPVPLSRHSCKRRPGEVPGGHGLVDLLLDPEATRCPLDGCGGRLAPWNDGFEGAGQLVAPPLLVSPHNRIDFASQTVRDGALFAYEVLPEGQRLRGFLRADGGEEIALLLEGLGLELEETFPLRVGRRKSVLGYLDCTLAPFTGTDGGVGLFPDAPPVPERWPEGEALRVDLVTPAIVFDRYLRYRESLTPADLGLSRPAFDGAFARSRLVAGWNAAHGLPKPDELAVQAGSSYLLHRPTSGVGEELQALAAAARQGIGRRRSEGFGAITVTRILEAQLPALRRREAS